MKGGEFGLGMMIAEVISIRDDAMVLRGAARFHVETRTSSSSIVSG